MKNRYGAVNRRIEKKWDEGDGRRRYFLRGCCT